MMDDGDLERGLRTRPSADPVYRSRVTAAPPSPIHAGATRPGVVQPGRTLTMLSPARTIIAAVLVFGVGGVLLIAQPADRQGQSPPGAAQEASPSPSASPSPPPSESAGSGPLAPGTYSPRFWPSLTMTVPDAWTIESGSDMFVGLMPGEQEVPAFVNVFRNMPVASADCEEATEPGVEDTAADMIGALAERPGLAVSGPVPVTIGGLSGLQLDFAVADDWSGTCAGIGTPWVPLVHMPGFVYWGAEPGERFRVIVLDVAPLPSDMYATVMVFIYAADAAVWDEHLAASMAIVDSFDFTVAAPM